MDAGAFSWADYKGAMGSRKNVLFDEILSGDGIAPYPGSMQVLDHLAETGVSAAIVSSSKNARSVLTGAALADRFDVADLGESAGR